MILLLGHWYADDVTLMSPSIRGLKQMVDILFGNGESSECHLKLNGQPVTWVREVKHLGNIVTSDLTDARDCARKRSTFIGSVNKLLGSYGNKIISRVMFFVNCFKYIVVPSTVQNYGVVTLEWNKAMRRILRIPCCWFNWGSRNILGNIYT